MDSGAGKWADDIIHHLQRIRAEAQPIAAAPRAPGAASPSNPLDGAAIAAALAEHLKNDNSTTQSVAIRLANLAQKYPNKGY